VRLLQIFGSDYSQMIEKYQILGSPLEDLCGIHNALQKYPDPLLTPVFLQHNAGEDLKDMVRFHCAQKLCDKCLPIVFR